VDSGSWQSTVRLLLQCGNRQPERLTTIVIQSIGIDIIEIERVRQAMERRPGMAARLFTERERAYCDRHNDPSPHYAARFAAKEAIAKAFGCWLRWHEVEIVNESSGRPRVILYGRAASLARADAGEVVLVSLSHSREYAVACALLAPKEISCLGENEAHGGVWT